MPLTVYINEPMKPLILDDSPSLLNRRSGTRGFKCYIFEPWYQLLHLYARAFCTRSTVATVALVFKLCEGSCTGSLNNRPVWKICLTTKSGRLCVSLWISHWKYVALQGVFLVTLRLIKWIIWIQCWEIELFVTDFAIFYRNWLLKHF